MRKKLLTGFACLLCSISVFSQSYQSYAKMQKAIDKNDTISMMKLISKTPSVKQEGLEHAIDKDNIAMINFLIGNNVNLSMGLIYAAKQNKTEICQSFLKKGANPNYVDQTENLYYFDSIYVFYDKTPQLIDYLIDEAGECIVPAENFSDSIKSKKLDLPDIGSTTVGNLYKSLSLESYLALENKIIQYKPKIGRRTSMYYAIEKSNIELINLLKNYGYNFSRPYIEVPMKHNIPSGFTPGVIMDDLLNVAYAGRGPIKTNYVVINVGDHNIYTIAPPTNAIKSKPLEHAKRINANKDIVDLLQSLSK